MFDTGATVNLYNRRAMIWDIKPVTGISIAGVGDGASPKFSCRGLWGPGFILENLPFSIASKHIMRMEGYHIAYELGEDEFIINGIGRFVYDPDTHLNIMSREEFMKFTSSKNLSANVVLPIALYNDVVPMVDGRQLFNPLQVRRAKLCKKIHSVLNHPSMMC